MSGDNIYGIGPLVRVEQATVPDTGAAGTVNGPWIDRLASNNKFDSCVLDLSVGATSGSPDSFTADAKLQDASDSGGSDAADYQPDGTAASGKVTQITAASSHSRKSIDLNKAKQYVRVVKVIAFVNGSSPKIPNAATLIFGGAQTKPAQSDT